MFNMVEDCNKLNMEPGLNDIKTDELYRSINSTFWKLFGVEFWFNELQCLTQQELHSFLQSSENLKKLYDAKIIHVNPDNDKDKVKNYIDFCLEYLKPVVEKYWTNDEVFDTILYVNDLLEPLSREKIEIEDLPELMDFFSKHIINKDKFDTYKKLSEYRGFSLMNIRYMVIAAENYLTRRKWEIPLEVNYKEIGRESVLLESRDKWAWIDPYGRIFPLSELSHADQAWHIISSDKYLRKKVSEYKWKDYREFLVQECGWVKFTGKKFFLKFVEVIRKDKPHFSFPINPITKRPRVTNEQLDAIIDICGTIPEELHQ